MPKEKRLSKKEREFIKNYLATGNGTRSVLASYDTTNEKTASVIAVENLGKPKIRNATLEALSDDLIKEKHLALLNKQEVIVRNNVTTGQLEVIPTGQIDVQAVKAGLDMAFKVRGDYAPIKTANINLNYEQRQKAKSDIEDYLNYI